MSYFRDETRRLTKSCTWMNGASQAILHVVPLSAALQGKNDVPVPEALTAYQDARTPPAAEICSTNKADGPDHVLQVTQEHTPGSFGITLDVVGARDLRKGRGRTSYLLDLIRSQ